jgi:hypothetical protein
MHALHLRLRDIMSQIDESHWDGIKARRGLVDHLTALDLSSLNTASIDTYLSFARDEEEALELCLTLTQDLETGIDELVALLVLRWKAIMSKRSESRQKENEEKHQIAERVSSRREGLEALASRKTLEAGERYMRRKAIDLERVNREGRVTLSSSKRGTGSLPSGVIRRSRQYDTGARDVMRKSRPLAEEEAEGSRVQMRHLVNLEMRKDETWWIRDLQDKRNRDQMFLQQALGERNGTSEPPNARLRYLPLSRDLQEKEWEVSGKIPMP